MDNWHTHRPVEAIRYTLSPAVSTPGKAMGTVFTRAGAHDRHSRLFLRRLLSTVLTLVASSCLVLFVIGQAAVVTPLYWNYVYSPLMDWWLPHIEMVRPSYLVLVGVVPTLVCALAVHWRRSLRWRREVWGIARLMRRRPLIFGWVSWFGYGELLFLTILVGGNAAVFWYSFAQHFEHLMAHAHAVGKPAPPHFSYVKVIGRCLGFNCVLNLVLLFLPATRNSVWMEFLGISYANGIKYHRWLGVVTILTGVVHCACYYWCWLRSGRWAQNALPCWHCSLDDHEGHHIWVNIFGELALLCFLLIAATSIPSVRRRMFNTFYVVHQLLFFAVFFTVLHWDAALWFLLPVCVGYLISRTLSCCNAVATANRVDQLTALSPTICKIILARSSQERGAFHAGQFLYLNVPAISRLEWHPFTIASSPNDPDSPRTMTLLVKALGDWTQKFMAYAKECECNHVDPEIYVDGYYGAALDEVCPNYSTVVLVGGGVGMAPVLALLEDMCVRAEARQARGRCTLHQKVFVIFAVRELELLEDIYPLIARVRELDPLNRHFFVSLTLTTTPCAKMLDASLRSRTYFNELTPLRPQQCCSRPAGAYRGAFAVPLGHNSSVSIYLVAFSMVTGLTLALHYDNGGLIDALSNSVWVVQTAVKTLAMLAASICVYTGVGLARSLRNMHAACRSMAFGDWDGSKTFTERLLPSAPPHQPAVDLTTYRDLISALHVGIGQRPDIALRLREAHAANHQTGAGTSTPIGVFVSGPSSMKAATISAVAAIGSSSFDIHEEEFEL